MATSWNQAAQPLNQYNPTTRNVSQVAGSTRRIANSNTGGVQAVNDNTTAGQLMKTLEDLRGKAATIDFDRSKEMFDTGFNYRKQLDSQSQASTERLGAMNASTERYRSDLSLQGIQATADSNLAAAGLAAEANKYGSLMDLNKTKELADANRYQSDSQLKGIQVNAATNRDIAGIEAGSRERVAKITRGTNNMANLLGNLTIKNAGYWS